jgi:hypothetical protein
MWAGDTFPGKFDTGAVSRALWRLPGRDFHPLEERVFQEFSHNRINNLIQILIGPALHWRW